MFKFTVTVPASGSLSQAGERCRQRLPEGFSLTGQADWRSRKHLLATVEVEAAAGADVDDAWVVLTSYGMSPGAELGSCWSGSALDV